MSGTLSILAAGFSTDASGLNELWSFFRALFDNRFDSADCVMWGAVLLGVTCGILGSFVVLRKQSLLGDAIGHAVLPGVVVGFLLAGGKSTPALLLGATVAGLLAAALIAQLQKTTVLKSSECMGVVFCGFYAVGIVLIKQIQKEPFTGQGGLERFLFGQIVGISTGDLLLMAGIAAAALACVVIFWRPLALGSFDEGFAASTGMPAGRVQLLLTTLLVIAIVVGIQAVGVVLVSALLITPAATAYLLTDRLHRMVLLAGGFGALSGAVGIALSVSLATRGRDMPTGATIVLAAGLMFTLAFALSPTHGLIPRMIRLVEKRRRTAAENLLRTIYLVLEQRCRDRNCDDTAADRRFGVDDIASLRHESRSHILRMSKEAARRGWVRGDSVDPIILTEEGLAEARRVVRNHRLWELFLTQEARLAADHVHADAEYIEHVLPRHVVEKLEAMLDSRLDPHGRPIPAIAKGGVS